MTALPCRWNWGANSKFAELKAAGRRRAVCRLVKFVFTALFCSALLWFATLCFGGCASAPKIEIQIPAMDFPAFPAPDGVEYDEGTDTVSMPLAYWEAVARYKIDVDALEKYVAGLRAAAGGGE